MNFDDLIRYKALHLKYTATNSALAEMMLDSPSGAAEVQAQIPMKNVCALLTQDLFDRLSYTCSLLDISKRTFIEKALVEALNKADVIVDGEEVHELLASLSQGEAA